MNLTLEIFISHDNLPFGMNPVPVNMERTLQWLERQVMPSIVMIEEIDRLTGSNYMKMIDECTHLSEKQIVSIVFRKFNFCRSAAVS